MLEVNPDSLKLSNDESNLTHKSQTTESLKTPASISLGVGFKAKKAFEENKGMILRSVIVLMHFVMRWFL